VSGNDPEPAGAVWGRQTPIPQEQIVVREVVERPREARAATATIDDISEWLVGPARQIEAGVAAFDEFAWLLLAAGMPVLRVTLHVPTIHPQFLGTTITWWRDTGRTTQVLIMHEVADAIPYQQNPVRRVCDGHETLRRRLDGSGGEFDFDVLWELRERGGTDYLALPMSSIHSANYMVTFVTDRPGGFADNEIGDLGRLARRLAVVVDRHSQLWITRNVLSAYLGERTGPKVLSGQIRRGAGMELTAVLWSSDMRGFTERSDRLPGARMIAILNALFDAQATEIRKYGGEILKFIGDGLLAIFPIEDGSRLSDIALGAITAAKAAIGSVNRLAADPPLPDEPPLKIVIALHVGTVNYGNIGAADRLDFTVIGPAVNLVSRIEAVAKKLELPIVVSGDFARALGGGMHALGPHLLRGLSEPYELFAPL
jgi:adenylate cyclase